MTCDLCGNAAACLQKEFEGRELDICEVCWCPLADNAGDQARLREILDGLEEYEETTV
jgi:hypothetical protein